MMEGYTFPPKPTTRQGHVKIHPSRPISDLIMTPDHGNGNGNGNDNMDGELDPLDFTKRPVSPYGSGGGTASNKTSPLVSENEAGSMHSGYGGGGWSEDEQSNRPSSQKPFSLLSALLSDNSNSTSNSNSNSNSASKPVDMTSSSSTSPSTAINSPNQAQNLLQSPPESILRRGSGCSETGLGLGELLPLPGLDQLSKVEEVPEPPKRTCSLKFAVAPPRKLLKPSSPIKPPSPIDDEVSDGGYEEDSEDGFSDGDSDWDDSEYPFARPTNYHEGFGVGDVANGEPETPPEPAPAMLPPPERRGRGHVRVVERGRTSENDHKACTRHCSPPPKERSHSRERRGSTSRGRLSDAGPREGRAGSPMPSKIPESDTEEDESPIITQAKPLPQPKSTSNGVFTSDDEVEVLDSKPHPMEEESTGEGVRNFLRRASESIGLRRPSIPTDYLPHPESTPQSNPLVGVSQSTCPPALDNTPIFASSLGGTNYPITHKIELSRTQSLHSPTVLSPLQPLQPITRRSQEFVRSKPVQCPKRIAT